MPSPATINIFSAFLCLLSIFSFSAAANEGSCQDYDDLTTWETPPPPESCRLFLSPRKNNNDGNKHNGAASRELGIFTAVEFTRGMPLTPRGGDVVLHLIDVDHDGDSNSQLGKWLSHGFLQDAIASGHGGNYEGLGKILTALPGIGMLASSPENQGRPNVWASVPETDEADLPRIKSPQAGSFSLHYNLTYVVTNPKGIERGGEVLVDRDGWHRRKALSRSSLSPQDENSPKSNRLDNQVLFQEGICLDNLYYDTSTHGYGRGGFASRHLEKGSIVAPIPVAPIPRKELRYLRSKEWKKVKAHRRMLKESNQQSMKESDIEDILPPNMEWRQQLLINYCLGHQNSSVLLFPYGHVNYVNNAPINSYDEEYNGPVANVGLRWSEKLTQKQAKVDPRTLTPTQLWNRTKIEGLVLEMVALRDIRADEEVLLDYGSIWRQAWESHVKHWLQDPQNGKEASVDDYTPAYIMEDVVSNLRTAEEQLQYPYTDNVFTACFYRYERDMDENETSIQPSQHSSSKKQTEAIPWKMSAGLFDMINLRPCKVISREPVTDRHASSQQQQEQQQQQQPGQGKMYYTTIIQNRPGLPPNERVPKGEKHIVSGIPREAFRFVDRPYTSDVHLDGAFRQNIGLEETKIFPEAWLDQAQ
ncbi:hypothetical protein ACHAXR_006074 [Thalassiosira sp. AJA248-18]